MTAEMFDAGKAPAEIKARVEERYFRGAGIDKMDSREVHGGRTPSLRMADDVGVGLASAGAGPCFVAIQIESDHLTNALAEIKNQRFTPRSYRNCGSRGSDRLELVKSVSALGPLPALAIDRSSVGM